jgi:hypothetical protein
MAIEVGNTAYVLKQRKDFTLYQVRAEVIAIQRMKVLSRHSVNLYSLVDGGGNAISTFHMGYIGTKKRICIRKTPFPNVEVLDERPIR